MNLILLSLLILLGRLAGGWKGNGWIYSTIIGIVFGLLFGVYDWTLVFFALAGLLSERPSPAKYCTGLITDNYAHVPGRGHSWFEIQYLRERPWLGATVRGVISTIIWTPLLFLYPVYAMVAFIPAWPLALYIGTKLPSKKSFAQDTWEWAESLRYAIVGLAIILF